MINYVTGDATQPQGEGPYVLPHICNDIGRWGAGFTESLSQRWPEMRKCYLEWIACQPDLGDIQTVQFSKDNITVVNMLAQHGVRHWNNPVPIRYDAVAECLVKVAALAELRGASIHAPRFGVGLARGNWNIIEPMVKTALCKRGLNVTIYDLPRR